MQTKAAILWELNSSLSVEPVELDAPREGEVQVRLVAAGVCHSDRHFMTGLRNTRLPVVKGHEGAGVVEAVGPGVTRVRPGDHVIQLFVSPCGRCRRCRRGRYTHCPTGLGLIDGTMLDGTYRMHARGQDVGSGSRLASFSHYTVMPESACVPIPKDIDLVSACLVGCGVSTGVGAALNIAGVRPGDSVAVFGVGGVGMAALVGSVVGGAGQVIAIDIHEAKLDRARSFGATDVVNASTADPVETIRALTDGWGVDKAILCIDHVDARHLSQAVDCLDSCGTAVLCGAVDFALDYLPVRPAAMMRDQKTFTATLYGGTDPARDVLRYLDLYRAGRLPLEKFVTATYPLERINDAFDDMVAGRNLRGVIVYD